MFALHVLLSFGVAAFSDAFTPMGIVGSFVLIYLVLKLASRLTVMGHYMLRLEQGVAFTLWFGKEIVLASIDVAKIVLARKVDPSPAIVKVRLEDKREGTATLIGLLLTLTPGTMALDYDPETGDMVIHALNAHSLAEVEDAVREMERRLLNWMHPERLKGASSPRRIVRGEKREH